MSRLAGEVSRLSGGCPGWLGRCPGWLGGVPAARTLRLRCATRGGSSGSGLEGAAVSRSAGHAGVVCFLKVFSASFSSHFVQINVELKREEKKAFFYSVSVFNCFVHGGQSWGHAPSSVRALLKSGTPLKRDTVR